MSEQASQSKLRDSWVGGLASNDALIPIATTVGLLGIFLLCFLLWEIGWLRPYLAAGGAGIAAFLGPIPGIVSPESRSKWMFSIFVAAIITAGTWLATQDLEGQLSAARDQAIAVERSLANVRQAAVAAQADDESHIAVISRVLVSLPTEAKGELFKTASSQLWAIYNEKKLAGLKQDDRDYRSVLALSKLLLQVDRENGHGLYYAGEAQAKLENRPEMLRLFQHYLASAARRPEEAESGQAHVCYSRASGICAERAGWVSHILADYYLQRALAAPQAERAALLSQSFAYERDAVELEKWPKDHHHPGFDSGGITPGYSSCKILLTLIGEFSKLGLEPTPIIQVGQARLPTECGVWPSK